MKVRNRKAQHILTFKCVFWSEIHSFKQKTILFYFSSLEIIRRICTSKLVNRGICILPYSLFFFPFHQFVDRLMMLKRSKSLKGRIRKELLQSLKKNVRKRGCGSQLMNDGLWIVQKMISFFQAWLIQIWLLSSWGNFIPNFSSLFNSLHASTLPPLHFLRSWRN